MFAILLPFYAFLGVKLQKRMPTMTVIKNIDYPVKKRKLNKFTLCNPLISLSQMEVCGRPLPDFPEHMYLSAYVPHKPLLTLTFKANIIQLCSAACFSPKLDSFEVLSVPLK